MRTNIFFLVILETDLFKSKTKTVSPIGINKGFNVLHGTIRAAKLKNEDTFS